MARIKRLKVVEEDAYYHITSRTVRQEFFIEDVEKEKLLSIIKRYSALYFVKVLGYAVMSNHFHLLVKIETGEQYSDKDVCRRLQSFYSKDDGSGGEDTREGLYLQNLDRYRKKLGDLSEYVKCIKQTFSWWYNRRQNCRGYFWSDRFKSVLIERGEGLLNCLGYIDLNPVRAGIVARPEDYRWSSLGYRVQHGCSGSFLSFCGIFDTENGDDLRKYREFVYRSGGIEKEEQGSISDDVLLEEKGRRFELSKKELLAYRLRYFSDGLVLGSRGFIQEAYSRFGGHVFYKKDRKAHATGISESLFSIRYLKSQNSP
ncbi:MAG: transposase [Candidatus Aminicenantes bacterium]|nr:transposase [Candidatus Aminicenantes bacterium]